MMDLSLFRMRDAFPRIVMGKLSGMTIDYKKTNREIDHLRQKGSKHLKAAVVLLLNFKKTDEHSEYVFQLIKRSDKVSQSGDISCPGGMLQPQQDRVLSSFLKNEILPALDGRITKHFRNMDDETVRLIRLFLTTALREAWEEIGLNPLNTRFLGALPSHPLTFLSRTIFPVVCCSRRHFSFKLNSEVEKVFEIPLSYFFQNENYAVLDVTMTFDAPSEPFRYQTPCLTVSDGDGNIDILWGATFNIIRNFLHVISDGNLPSATSSRILTKTLTNRYISPGNER